MVGFVDGVSVGVQLRGEERPLVPIGGEMSILEIVLRQLRAHGFTSATLAIGHLGQIIRAYVGDGSEWDIDVNFHLEEEPLGTIGPLLYMKDYLPERFVVMNGTPRESGGIMAVGGTWGGHTGDDAAESSGE